ncbi:hypothetical protein CA984_17065 [Streptosporangium minutum]|uniref:Uncharacterized protein n=1 Tax=Streptosporangium minutum TaxID=569862 RepID=A0A243RNP2_9ACTN|nr:hypothetical protein CA984_17065 [Streptosporangium minutum]
MTGRRRKTERDRLEAAGRERTAAFTLGTEPEGKAPAEGRRVERVIGIDDVRQDIAMLKNHPGTRAREVHRAARSRTHPRVHHP